MFHAARALLYSLNMREQSHYCGLLPNALLEGFEEAKNLREDADYYGRWTEAGCEKLIKIARRFLDSSQRLMASK